MHALGRWCTGTRIDMHPSLIRSHVTTALDLFEMRRRQYWRQARISSPAESWTRLGFRGWRSVLVESP